MSKVKTLNIEMGGMALTPSYEELLSAGEVRLKIFIQCDYYYTTMSATIFIFSTTEAKWNEVANIDPANMKSRGARKENVRPGHYAIDRDRLVEKAAMILDF